MFSRLAVPGLALVAVALLAAGCAEQRRLAYDYSGAIAEQSNVDCTDVYDVTVSPYGNRLLVRAGLVGEEAYRLCQSIRPVVATRPREERFLAAAENHLKRLRPTCSVSGPGQIVGPLHREFPFSCR